MATEEAGPKALVPAAEAKAEKSPVAFGRAGVILTSLEELWRFAKLASESDLVPKGLDTPQKVAIAIQYGAEFGVPPMAALRAVRVINGIPGWMGDMALGIVRASGKMADFKKTNEGDGDSRQAVVTTTRVDASEPITTTFSVKDAKTAGLWGKQGPWSQYPDRMLYYRALGFNLRDNFPDVMGGAAIAEELADYPVNEVRHIGTGSTQKNAQALPAVDQLLESIGVTSAPDPTPPVEEPMDAVVPGCPHPLVPPSRLAGGKRIVCPDCGEELSGEREELTLTAPSTARRSKQQKAE